MTLLFYRRTGNGNTMVIFMAYFLTLEILFGIKKNYWET